MVQKSDGSNMINVNKLKCHVLLRLPFSPMFYVNSLSLSWFYLHLIVVIFISHLV